MKINMHKDTRVIKLHFTLADDAMFDIIWFMRCFSFLFQTVVVHKMYNTQQSNTQSSYRVIFFFFFFLWSQLKITNDKKSLPGSWPIMTNTHHGVEEFTVNRSVCLQHLYQDMQNKQMYEKMYEKLCSKANKFR